jgi:3-phenylpropionate/trans-cinnamate dioxygenase ferredoxin subunit
VNVDEAGTEAMGPAWESVSSVADLPEGKAVKVMAFGEDVLLWRTEDAVFAVSNRCTHQGAPLARGVVKPMGGLPSVTCFAHGSVFSLVDGRVLRGPAAKGLTAYHARIEGNEIQLRLKS